MCPSIYVYVQCISGFLIQMNCYCVSAIDIHSFHKTLHKARGLRHISDSIKPFQLPVSENSKTFPSEHYLTELQNLTIAALALSYNNPLPY